MGKLNKFQKEVIEALKVTLADVEKYSNSWKWEDYSIELEEGKYSTTKIMTTKGSIVDKIILRTKAVRPLEEGEPKDTKNREEAVVEFEIPKDCGGMFVIDGKKRLNLNYLQNSVGFTIVKRLGKKKKSSMFVLSFNMEADVQVEVSINEDGTFCEPIWKFLTRTWENNTWKITEEEVSYEDFQTEVEFAKDSYTSAKIKVMLDLDYFPTKITKELVYAICKAWTPQWWDNIVNKEIIHTTDLLARHLRNPQTRNKMNQNLRSYFYKYGKINAKPFTSQITAFFNQQTDDAMGVCVPTNTNPESYECLSDKIILAKDKARDPNVAVTYMNRSLTDIIDVVITPDNANVNRANELTKAVVLGADRQVFMRCYDLEFNEIQVPMREYVCSRIIPSKYVDYENKEIKEVKEYKLGGLLRTNTDKHDFSYIEIEDDERLSSCLRRIPMVNLSDSVRSSMGARMLTQSIEVVGAERPIVSSGHDKIKSTLVVTSDIEGIVEKIHGGYVEVRADNGAKYKIEQPNNLEGQYDINITFKACVKVGDKVKVGTQIYRPQSIDADGYFNYGVNVLVAQMPYDGNTYEDGVIISESASKKFAHISVRDVILRVTNDIILQPLELKEEYHNGDSLLTYAKRVKTGIGEIFKNISEEEPMYLKSLKTPMNVGSSHLVDVCVLDGDIESNVVENVLFIDKLKELELSAPQGYDFKPISDMDDIDEDLIKTSTHIIKFRFFVYNYLNDGDKITTRYGSKGVESVIIPDEEMPRLEDGRVVDVVLNPSAVVARKNPPQTIESNLSCFACHLVPKLLNMLDEGKVEEVRAKLKRYHIHTFGENTKQGIYNSLKERNYQIVVGTLTNLRMQDVVEWYKEEGISFGEKILVKNRRGKWRCSENVVEVGYIYMYKLYHLSSKKCQVTRNGYVKDVLPLGIGKISKEGLSLGSMEQDVLFAYNMEEYISYIGENNPLKSGKIFNDFILGGFGLEPIRKD